MNHEAITKFGQSLRGALIGRSHPAAPLSDKASIEQ